MNELNPLKLVLSVIDSECPSNVNIGEISNRKDVWKAAIKLAEKNGLSYYFIKRLRELDIYLPFLENVNWNEKTKRISKFKETITYLNGLSDSSGIDYILIKTFNTIPNIPNDVDIFLRKEHRREFINLLENNVMKRVQSSVAETKLKGEYQDIDVYTEINYLGVDFIGERFLWESSVQQEVFGVQYPGLNTEADLLLLIPHYLFGHRGITLLDFLHLRQLRNKANTDICKRYTSECGWRNVFELVLEKLDDLQENIYSDEEITTFPYLFEQRFTERCIGEIDGLSMTVLARQVLRLSFALDKVVYEMRDTPFYNLLKSARLTRNAVNSLSAFLKTVRGDKKSTEV